VRITLALAVLFSVAFNLPSQAAKPAHFQPANASQPAKLPLFKDVRVYVTGYNTTTGQTDDTPCIAASGVNICGRTDAVACPRSISLGTVLQIRGVLYVCEDRLAKKYDSRFDISCDKDTDCPNKVTGWVVVRIFPVRRDPGVITPTAAPAEPAADTPVADIVKPAEDTHTADVVKPADSDDTKAALPALLASD
jgi:hypothetical protein